MTYDERKLQYAKINVNCRFVFYSSTLDPILFFENSRPDKPSLLQIMPQLLSSLYTFMALHSEEEAF
jgi:hypothetical protein